MTFEASESGLRRRMLQVEATLGAMFAFLYGFALIVIGGDIIYLNWSDRQFAWFRLIGLFLIIAEFGFLWSLKRSLERDHRYPFAPNYAGKWRSAPKLLRPAMVAWALAHWGWGIWAIVWLDRAVFGNLFPSLTIVWRMVLLFGLGFTISYSTNLYALLVLASAGARERFIERCWRWRAIFDVCIVVAAAMLWQK